MHQFCAGVRKSQISMAQEKQGQSHVQRSKILKNPIMSLHFGFYKMHTVIYQIEAPLYFPPNENDAIFTLVPTKVETRSNQIW